MSDQWTVGIDFGGTNIKCGIVDGRGRVRRTLSVPTNRCATPRAFVDGVAGAVNTLARGSGIRTSQLRGVGIGAPGLIDAARGIVHSLVNVPGWHDVPLARRLSARLRTPVRVENDANLVALGEYRFGAGRGARSFLCLTLGTGVGGGLICDGRMYRGVSGSAGEIGHTVIDLTGARCGCGRRGCLEALVGTAAILRLGRQALRSGSPTLRALVRREGRLMPRLIGRAARSGEAPAQRVWQEIGRRLGVGLANLVNLLNPDCIVLGGGIANNWSSFAPAMMKTLRADAMDVPGGAVRVLRSRLGDEAGILGAAVLVWDELGDTGRARPGSRFERRAGGTRGGRKSS